MKKYVKKPIVVEAMKFEGDMRSYHAIVSWVKESGFNQDYEVMCNFGRGGIALPTLEGDMTANVGDWIIKGVKGEFYPCKPDIFEATYTELTDKW